LMETHSSAPRALASSRGLAARRPGATIRGSLPRSRSGAHGVPATKIPFTKMQRCGNDYVYVDGFHHHVDDPVAMAKAVSDRRFGVGSDGLILVLPSDKADVKMRMWNSDGSESEMCGNGIRCVAKFAYERGLAPKKA